MLDGAAGVAIDARNAYVAGLTSDSITVFRRNANGSLTQIGCVDIGGTSCVTAAPASLDGAFDVAMDARNVYVVSTVFGSVTTFARAADGSLTQTQCISRAPISGCTTSGSLDSATAVTIDDTNVYVASFLDRSITTFARGADGALTQTGCISHATLAGCTTASYASLDGVTDIAMDATNVYAASSLSDAITTFTRGTGGALTQAGCISQASITGCATAGISSLDGAYALAMNGSNVYVISQDSHAVTTFTRGSSGALTQTSCISQITAGCTLPSPASLDLPTSIAVVDNTVYVAAATSRALTTFTRGPGGSLTAAGCIAASISGCTALPFGTLNSEALAADRNDVYLSSSTAGAVMTFERETAPGAPTAVTGVGGDGSVAVSWSAPSRDGASPITSYTATASGGGSHTCTAATASCVVTGLTNGTTYTFTVTATNANGTSAASSPSAAVTPAAVVTPAATATSTPAKPRTPRNIRWSPPRVRTTAAPIRAVFTATAGLAYTITARAKGTAARRGACKVKTNKKRVRIATCTIRLTRAGTWTVRITPKQAGVSGVPATKRLVIRAPKA